MLQEGPHSTLPEDEFFDAVETGLDKIEEERQQKVRLKLQTQQVNDRASITHHFIPCHAMPHIVSHGIHHTNSLNLSNDESRRHQIYLNSSVLFSFTDVIP